MNLAAGQLLQEVRGARRRLRDSLWVNTALEAL